MMPVSLLISLIQSDLEGCVFISVCLSVKKHLQKPEEHSHKSITTCRTLIKHRVWHSVQPEGQRVSGLVISEGILV